MGSDVSGVQVLARGGSVVVATSSGLADVAAGQPCTRRTRSQVASISKQFAAVVALNLIDGGALTLGETVASVLPDCPVQWQAVTLQQLLTHTSGMSHWGERPGFDPAQVCDPADRLALLLAAPLLSPPGARWRYSSPGYLVLSAVLERAAQAPYGHLVEEQIIEPLGLIDTTVGQARGAGAAVGYRGGEPVTPWDLHTMAGTGDIWSTADDIARFVAAVHEGTLLSEGVQRTLHAITVAHDPDDEPARVRVDGYGLGHFVGTVDGQFGYLHPGDNPGYQALAVWMPATQTAAVVLSNDETDDLDEATADLLADQPDD